MTREEAIEIIKREFAMDEDVEKLYPEVVEARNMAISALEQEPCDAISREAVQKAIDKWYENNNQLLLNNCVEDLIVDVMELPSVQPSRKGHWIKRNENIFNYKDEWYVCSECNVIINDMPTCIGKPMYEFCPSCGASMADMRGDTE